MLSNMASSLIQHKRISTTVAKAKALRKYVEPLITKAKNDSTHSRRIVFSYLQNKESITELFGEVADKVANRPGGYTRIIRTGHRLGDNAEMCIIELVDYNELLLEAAAPATKSRRSRRGRRKKGDVVEQLDEAVEVTDEVIEDAEVVEEESSVSEVEEEVTAETEEVVADAVEESVAEVETEEPVAEVETEAPAAEVEEAPATETDGPEASADEEPTADESDKKKDEE